MTYALHAPYGAANITGTEKSEKWATEYISELADSVTSAYARIIELEAELQLYRALCDGYTLEELQHMSLTFKAQIDMLRERTSVPRDTLTVFGEAVRSACYEAALARQSISGAKWERFTAGKCAEAISVVHIGAIADRYARPEPQK